MSEPTKAVFLSYASQDAEAAKKICEALRQAGVEVWFDQSELVGGDAWDQKIRKQIRECALFVPILSKTTQGRREAYFRLEWKLADERTHLMAKGTPFLLPITIDETNDRDALVPDSFLAVQWTKAPSGETPPAFGARVKRLLSNDQGSSFAKASEDRAGSKEQEAIRHHPATSSPSSSGPKWIRPVLASAVIVIAVLAITLIKRSGDEKPVVPAAPTPVSVPPPTKLSEVRQLVAKARGLFDALDASRDDYKLAEELIAQARAKDATDAEVSAVESQLASRYLARGWDTSDARRETARAAAQRAIRLDAQSYEARLAVALLLPNTGREREDKERQLRELRRERPTDQRVLRYLATTLDRQPGRLDEAFALDDESAALPGGDPLALYNKSLACWFAGRTAEADAAIQASIAQQPFTGALLIHCWYQMLLHGDLDGARATLNRIAPAEMSEDRAAFYAYTVEMMSRQPAAALARLAVVPRDWLNDFWYRGPKGLLVGNALQLDGRRDAAVLEWRSALRLVDERLVTNARDVSLLFDRIRLLALLGEREEAARQFTVLLQIVGIDLASEKPVPYYVSLGCAMLGRKVEAIEQIRRGLKLERHAVDYTAATLRLDPLWDPLRSDPEFAGLIAEAEAIERAAAGAVQKTEDRGQKTGGLKTAPDEKSVAVLAFANLSDDKSNEYFSDGISEELLNVLAKVPGLKVTARTSSFHFKGKDTPIPEIAQQLGVAYVVEGSVRKSGEKVRITAQLIKAADGFHVWSDTFTRDLKDIFAVQDEIAGLIAQQLQVKLGTSKAPREVNPEAHRLVLEGRHFWGLRTENGFDRAEEAFRRAIELDPEFAPAHAGLALVLGTRLAYTAYLGETVLPGEEQRAEAQRALAIDPAQPEAIAALGQAYFQEGRDAESAEEYRKGLALNPNSALLHHWYSLTLENSGRLDEALAEITRATELDPLSGIALVTRERFLVAAGRYAEALELRDRVMGLLPEVETSFGMEAMSLLKLGRTQEAVDDARKITSRSSLNRRIMVDAHAVHVLRQTGHEKEAAEHAAAIMPRFRPTSYQRGTVLVALGNWEEAVPFLERTPRTVRYLYYWDPTWDAWRDDPRFQQLIKKLGCEAEYRTARETLARMQRERSAAK